MAELATRILKCRRCQHEWIPRKQPVRQCPKCKTLDFDKPKAGKD